jgi:hypothetical protein
MATLTDFLLARIAEDEARAPRRREDYYDRPCPRCGRPVSGLGSPLDDEAVRALHPDDLSSLGCSLTMEQWNALMPDLGPSPDGARVLAECEAKRRILELAQLDGLTMYERVQAEVDPVDAEDFAGGAEWALIHTLRALALPYAHHPHYREEWRP